MKLVLISVTNERILIYKLLTNYSLEFYRWSRSGCTSLRIRWWIIKANLSCYITDKRVWMYKLQITWWIIVTNSVQMKSGFCHWCTAYGQDGGSLQQTDPDFCHWLVWMYKLTMRQWITVAHRSVKTITDQSGCTHWWLVNVTNWSWVHAYGWDGGSLWQITVPIYCPWSETVYKPRPLLLQTLGTSIPLIYYIWKTRWQPV